MQKCYENLEIRDANEVPATPRGGDSKSEYAIEAKISCQEVRTSAQKGLNGALKYFSSIAKSTL